MIYLVTGGSRGLGAGIVQRAAAEGHDVALTYQSNTDAAAASLQAARQARPQGHYEAFAMDVRQPDHVESVVDAVLDAFDTIDVVVNCAGVTRDNLLVSMLDDEWRDVLETNLFGPFHVCRQVLPTMLANRFGRIINISSIQYGGGTGQGNYAASKAGLHGLTKTLAREYGRRGITANVVVPGFFDTDMTRENLTEENRRYWAEHCPMPDGRFGELSELTGVVTFLASPAGGYINGEIMHVTGGLDTTR